MKFSIEKLKNFNQKIKITISLDYIKKIIQQEIIKVKKKTIMNGFRKNKVPTEIIKKEYGKTIEKNVLKHIMEDNFRKIVQENNINIITKPNITIEKYTENSDLIYSVDFQAIPKIDFNKLKCIKIKKLIINIEEQDIKNTIEKIRNQTIIWKNTKSCIKKNNKITAKACILDTSNKHNKIKNFQFQFITCKNQVIPELETAIINKKIGDNFTIMIHIPDYHPEATLRGQQININIEIKKIEHPIPNYSKLEFIKYLIKKFKIKNDIQELYSIIKNNIQNEIKNLKTEYLYNQAIKKCKTVPLIDIPNELLKEEINIIMNELHQRYMKNNGNVVELLYWTDIPKQAKNNIYNYLMIQSIIYQKKIQVYEQEVKDFIQNINKINKNLIKHNISHTKEYNDMIEKIRNIILEKKIHNIFCKMFTIIEKKCNFRNALKIHTKIANL